MTLHSIKMSFAALAAAVALSACSNAVIDEPTPDSEADGWHSCTLRFDNGKPSFDPTSRDGNGEWQAGNTVYINFSLSNGQSTYGNAVRKDDGTWTLNYNGRLSSGSMFDCQVFYISGEYVSNDLKTEFELKPANAVYADRNAKYSYNNGELILSATLAPVTSRIRFVYPDYYGYEPLPLRLRGIEYISGLNIQTLAINTVNTNSVEESSLLWGYGTYYDNRYIYGTFPADGELRMLINNYKYTFDLPSDLSNFMAVGTSGFINIPTPSAHNGWLIEQYGGSTEPELVGTYSSPTSGTGGYTCHFTINGSQLLRVEFTNIEQYSSSLTVQIRNANNEDVYTISRSTSALSPFYEDVVLSEGSYTALVSTSARRCTFNFYLVNNFIF